MTFQVFKQVKKRKSWIKTSLCMMTINQAEQCEHYGFIKSALQ